MKNHANKKMPSIIVLVTNLSIIAVIIMLFIGYIRQYNQKLYEQNLQDISNVNQASASVAFELSSSYERKMNNILRYESKNNFSVQEFMKYVSDYNADTSATFQLIGEDYTGYALTQDENGVYPSVSYKSKDYSTIQQIIDSDEVDTAAIPFTVEFTDANTGFRSFGQYAHFSLKNDDDTLTNYTLLLVSKSSDFIEHIDLNGGFEDMSTVLINSDGSYALRNADFKSDNFFQYLYLYNDLTLDQLDDIKNWLHSDEGGSIQYKNSVGEECAFVYSPVQGSDWYCVSSVPIISFHNEQPDLFFTLILGTLLLCLMAVDIYYLYQLNSVLKERAKEANAANEAKTDFLSRMSHDIRTPINVISGMTQLALLEKDPDRMEEYLKNIQSSSKFLLGLVNDILDMNKVESGNMELHKRPYAFSEFVTYINAVIRPLCIDKDIDFQLNGNLGDVVINADPLRINQIFFNLCSNAVKFTPKGGHITLEGNKMDLDNNRVALELSVCDDGVGMSKEFQENMFSAFSQENRTISLNTAGTGLGLAIVKKLVDLMNGTIRVESEIDQGTKFFVHFEFETAEALPTVEKHIASANILSGKRILLCEDHPLNAKIVVRMLSQNNVLVDVAENGEIGVEKFKESEIGSYVAILMDIRMPVMDGMEATRAIRAIPNRNDATSIPIIALTANAYDEDVQGCMQAGMNAHLAKPVDYATLLDTLSGYVISLTQADKS